MIKNSENLILNYEVSVPLVVEELNVGGILNAVEIPASIDSADLGIQNNGKEWMLPLWAEKLKENAQNKEKIAYLIIKDIDKIDFLEQDKFYLLLKNSRINGFDFPNNVRIIMTAKKGGFARLSKRIQSLCVVLRA